jgi:hypothetical protein
MSTDSGLTWTARGPANLMWYAVASSDDGTKLVAGAMSDGLYSSTDSGATWVAGTYSEGTGALTWRAAAASSDGTKFVAAPTGGRVFTSSW